MTETITNIVKFSEEEDDVALHTLKIETIKNDKKWNAFICIHIPNHMMHIPIMPNYICDIKLNGTIINDYKDVIGRNIIRKEHCQIDEHTKGTPTFSKSHMTKLSFILDNNDILDMMIAEVYDTRIDNYYEHSGGDFFL
jgi:hypothetical protein